MAVNQSRGGSRILQGRPFVFYPYFGTDMTRSQCSEYGVVVGLEGSTFNAEDGDIMHLTIYGKNALNNSEYGTVVGQFSSYVPGREYT